MPKKIPVDRMDSASTFAKALQTVGWNIDDPIPIDASDFALGDLKLWQIAYDKPTVLLFAQRDQTNDEQLRKDAMRICHLTPSRSMIVVTIGLDDDSWAISVCPTWKQPTRIIRGHRTALRAWESDCFDMLSQTTDCLDAVLQLTVLMDRKDTSHAFFKAIEQHATIVDNAWRSTRVISDEHRRELTILLFCRLLFVYFLERKQWLGHGPRWIAGRLLSVKEADDPDDDSVWKKRLQPLLFDLLNTPRYQRTQPLDSPVPYVNGGLFDRTPVEQKYPSYTLSNEVLRNLLLEVFERYRFADSSDPQKRAAIDPEMMGIVFERLMNRQERASSGAFYTPPTIAKGIARKTIERHIESRRAASGRVQTNSQILDDIKILDPACGSGTFLVSALKVLEQYHQAPNASTHDRAARRRHIITNNLFGVDISPLAIRVAEFRLWLALVDVMPDAPTTQPPPLPNLSHQLIAGDFLLDPASNFILNADRTPFEQHAKQSQQARQRFAESHGQEKARARIAMEQAAETLTKTMENNAKKHASASQLWVLHNADDACSKITDIQNDPQQTPWRAGRFCVAFHFAHVLASGGFDIILGNPPWVRWSDLTPARRLALRKRYQTLQSAPGSMHGAQPDLCLAFVERAFQIAKPGAQIAWLLSAKPLRADSAFHARRWINTAMCILSIDDYSRRDQRLFGADAYSMCVHLQASPPPEEHHVDVRAEGDWLHIKQSRLCGRSGQPWLIPTSAAELEAMEQTHAGVSEQTISSITRVRYGIKTGCNRVFINPPLSDIHTVPVVRGRNIKDGSFDCLDRLLFPHHRVDGTPLRTLSSRVLAYMNEHKTSLLQRSDLKQEALWWRLFRVRRQALGHRVAWADLSESLDPVYLPPVIDGGPVALNTVYSLAVSDRGEAMCWLAWLRTPRIQRLASLFADTALSGYRRFRSGVIGRLPAPPNIIQREAQGSFTL